uniref:Myotubularin phosphatase domain-containing protein n=1 Tax=Ascaris lumbricoides TaxID=6252 RepID=A0A0M3HIC7_ASCLU
LIFSHEYALLKYICFNFFKRYSRSSNNFLQIFRFYYENKEIFTVAQLRELKKISFARIICDSGDSTRFVPKDAFEHSKLEDLFSCEQIASPDWRVWKETIRKFQSMRNDFEKIRELPPNIATQM